MVVSRPASGFVVVVDSELLSDVDSVGADSASGWASGSAEGCETVSADEMSFTGLSVPPHATQLSVRAIMIRIDNVFLSINM